MLYIPPGRLFGHFYSVVYVANASRATTAHLTLTKHLRLRSELWASAERGVSALQDLVTSSVEGASSVVGVGGAEEAEEGHTEAEEGHRHDGALPPPHRPHGWLSFHSRQGK